MKTCKVYSRSGPKLSLKNLPTRVQYQADLIILNGKVVKDRFNLL